MIFSIWCKTCIISWKGTCQFSKHFLTSCDFVTPSFVEIYFLSGQLCSSWNFLFSPIIGLFIRQSDLHNAFLILNILIVSTMHTTHYYDWPCCLIGVSSPVILYQSLCRSLWREWVWISTVLDYDVSYVFLAVLEKYELE